MQIVSLLLIVAYASALSVSVGGAKSECFIETLKKSGHIAIYYQVTEGSDIDFVMYKPNGQIFNEQRRTQSGEVDSEADMDGDYKICLDNSYAGFTASKVVALYMAFDDNMDVAQEEQANKVESLATEMNHLLTHARIEVVMLQLRNQMHQALLENAYSWSTGLFIFQGILIICMALIQTYFIKKYFEVKRTI